MVKTKKVKIEGLNLPSILTEDTWFYKQPEYQKMLKKHLGKYYVSYSTASGVDEYFPDFVKNKLIGLPNKGSVYTRLGNFLGEAVEKGYFSEENPDGFEGMENIDLEVLRVEGAEYERLIVVDFGEWILIGFIDRYVETEDGVVITDFKTGAKNKKKQYLDPSYTQVMLYANAVENEGKTIADTNVYFIEREGSHIKPPLRLTSNQETLPLEYSDDRVKYALNKLVDNVKKISKYKNVYDKYFG